MKNTKIYIVLSNTGTLLTRMIGKYTKIPYNHVSICFDDELHEIYSFGRKKPWFPAWGGFVQEELDEGGVYYYFSETVCTIYELNITYENHRNLRKNVDKFKKNRRRYYFNALGFLGIIINHPIKLPYGYFCSNFVAYVLQQSGIDLFEEKNPALVTPNDFYMNKKLNKIYEGKILDYNMYKSAS